MVRMIDCRLVLAAAVLGMLVIPENSLARRGYAFSTTFLEKRLEIGSPNHVELAQVSDTPVIYLGWGIRSFRYPARMVAEAATDFAAYPRTFQYVHRCDRITSARTRLSPLGTWYVEGRAANARVWAIGDIDSLCWSDSTHFRFIAHQNEDRRLEAQWKYRVDGWLNLRTHGVKLAAFIVAAGPDSCRVGVVAQGVMPKPMPQWLIKLTMSLVLPQLMQDLETEVARRARSRGYIPPPSPPWWKRAWRAMFG